MLTQADVNINLYWEESTIIAFPTGDCYTSI